MVDSSEYISACLMYGHSVHASGKRREYSTHTHVFSGSRAVTVQEETNITRDKVIGSSQTDNY